MDEVLEKNKLVRCVLRAASKYAEVPSSTSSFKSRADGNIIVMAVMEPLPG